MKKQNDLGRAVSVKGAIPSVLAASQHAAEIRKEMHRLERRTRELEESLRAVAMKFSLVVHPEGSSRPKTPSFVVSEDVHPLKTDAGVTQSVQRAMGLETKRQAEIVIGAVVKALEKVLFSKLGQDGFAIKLGAFGKFKVRHVNPTRRKVGFSGKVVTTNAKRKIKFVPLGMLRASEVVHWNV